MNFIFWNILKYAILHIQIKLNKKENNIYWKNVYLYIYTHTIQILGVRRIFTMVKMEYMM